MIGFSFAFFAFYSIERYLAFQTGFFDLGLGANSIWRTINGYETWSSLILPSTPGHINHISPVLGLVALVYSIAPDPRTLLVLQDAVVAIAALPLYLVGLRETRRQFLSLTIAGMYLANPALHGVIRYDFHVESFIPLFSFLVYFFYARKSPFPFYLSVALLLSTIEYSAILGLGIAASWWVVKKRLDRRILTTLIASLALLSVIILSTVGRAFEQWNWSPNWLGTQFFGPASSSGTGFSGVLLAALEYNPLQKILYFFIVTAPIWFSILKYPVRVLPGVPWILVVAVVPRYSYSNVDFQYSVFLIPFVYLAAIPFFSRIANHRRQIIALALVALSITVLSSCLSPIRPYPIWPSASPLFGTVISIANSLPQNATILTEHDLFPQLSDKPYVTINYSSPQPPQYIFVNVDSVWYNWTNPGLGYPLSAREQTEHFKSLYKYDLIVQDVGLQLYRLNTL